MNHHHTWYNIAKLAFLGFSFVVWSLGARFWPPSVTHYPIFLSFLPPPILIQPTAWNGPKSFPFFFSLVIERRDYQS